jgi:hypothetical protein
VRGFEHLLVCDAQYFFKNAINISQHLVVPKPENEVAAIFEILSPARVLLSLSDVLTTIELNDQLDARTAEIDDKTIECHLPPKFQTNKAITAQPEPQVSFSVGLLLAQLTCNLDR